MKKLSEFIPLFTAIIAFVALIGGFSFAVDLIVKPLKKDIAHLSAGQARIESNLESFKSEVNIKFDQLNVKLDKILSSHK